MTPRSGSDTSPRGQPRSAQGHPSTQGHQPPPGSQGQALSSQGHHGVQGHQMPQGHPGSSQGHPQGQGSQGSLDHGQHVDAREQEWRQAQAEHER